MAAAVFSGGFPVRKPSAPLPAEKQCSRLALGIRNPRRRWNSTARSFFGSPKRTVPYLARGAGALYILPFLRRLRISLFRGSFGSAGGLAAGGVT
jgi:hypothetical protein